MKAFATNKQHHRHHHHHQVLGFGPPLIDWLSPSEGLGSAPLIACFFANRAKAGPISKKTL
jgi:hypothetical protein